MPELDDAAAAFTELVVEALFFHGELIDAGDRLTGPVGQTSARWQVLGVIEHGPATVAEVARTMHLRRQSVQRTADRLVADGVVEWRANPRHRRSHLMALTERGRAVMATITEVHARWAARVAAGHDPARLREAADLLRALRADLEADAGRPRPEVTPSP